MAKVKIRVSGCFRTQTYGQAYARISSYLQSMGTLPTRSLNTMARPPLKTTDA